MKKLLLIFSLILCTFNLNAAESKYKENWQKKTYNEKYYYIEGFLDCGLNLSSDIEKQISNVESKKMISKKARDIVEIPVIYITFAVGNASTNGIDSIIKYIDECYQNEIYQQYSVYQLLVFSSRGNLMQIKEFQWMFEEY